MKSIGVSRGDFENCFVKRSFMALEVDMISSSETTGEKNDSSKFLANDQNDLLLI